MTDIVERLRNPANVFYEYAADKGAMLREAADEIERLRETVRSLRAALRQISHAPNGKVHCADGHEECVLMARAALGEGK